MKEGRNLTKMNVGSLHLSLMLSLTRLLEYKDGERKKRRYDSPEKAETNK